MSGPSHPPRAQGNCRTTIFEGVSARRLRGRRRVRGAAGKHLCLNLYRKSSWVRSPLQSYKSLSTDYSRRGTGRRISSSADMNHSHHKCPCYPGRCHGSGTAAHENPPRSSALDRISPPDEDRKARSSSCRDLARWLWHGYALWDELTAFTCGLVATFPQRLRIGRAAAIGGSLPQATSAARSTAPPAHNESPNPRAGKLSPDDF